MPSDHFPNHKPEQDALLAFGVNLNRSYELWILELAPAKAAELLSIPAKPDVCVVCGVPISHRQTTCSASCRNKLWRRRRASP